MSRSGNSLLQPEDLPAMPLLEHLRELRTRLIYVVLALLVGMLLSLTVSARVIDALVKLCTVCQIQALAPTEKFVAYFRVGLTLGLVIATPVILYQLVAFMLPALHRHERRYLYLMMPGATVLFAMGLAFGFTLVLPRTIDFLASFLTNPDDTAAGRVVIHSNWSLSAYIAFVSNMLLITGLAFETPLVVYSLAKIGILPPKKMSRYRRHAILGFAVLAAVLTPTPDPFTMLMVMLPMLLLYELGLLMARFF